jgi:hypothetical protein
MTPLADNTLGRQEKCNVRDLARFRLKRVENGLHRLPESMDIPPSRTSVADGIQAADTPPSCRVCGCAPVVLPLLVERCDGFNSGVRALVGFQLCGCVPVEFGYFGLFDSVASLEYLPVQGVNATLPGPLGAASNVFQDGVTVRTDYRSRIQGAEVNFPCCFCCEDPCGDYARSREWFVGFRYLSLREDILISGAKPVGRLIETGYYDANSRNNLYGGQFGVRLRRCWGQFSCEGTGKVGLFCNQAGQEQVVVDYPNFLLRSPVSGNGENVAFVSALNLTGIYQINETWGLRAGYNVMWIEGVALAPDQLDFSFASTSGTGLNTAGGMFLHGVNVGLEARW